MAIVGKKIDSLLVVLQEKKCPKAFTRALLASFKTNKDKLKDSLNVEMIAARWNSINPELLEYYFDAFELKVDTVDNKENSAAFKIPSEE
jgi:hypothetical protein